MSSLRLLLLVVASVSLGETGLARAPYANELPSVVATMEPATTPPQLPRPLGKVARDAAPEPWRLDFIGYSAAGELVGEEWPARGPAGGANPMDPTGGDGEWAGLLPTGRFGHSAIYDPPRDRMLVFGGNAGGLCNDLWELALTATPAWTLIAPSGTPPSPRYAHRAIYDPVRDRMVLFGGFDGVPLNDVWELSLSGTPVWTQIATVGTPPVGRRYPTAIYDALRDRMIVFGGHDGSTPYLNDVWALSLAGTPVWTQIGASGPQARYGHSAIYDPPRDRMVVFGGTGGGVTWRNDVWALSLAGSPAWTPIAPLGTPPDGRHSHTSIYDPVRDRMLMFAGFVHVGTPDDTWELSLADWPAWTELAPAGVVPTARYAHSAIYDPVRDRMVVYAGWSSRNDLWALSLPETPAWIAISVPPSGRGEHTAVFDPVRNRMVVFGGWSALDDAWGLALTAPPVWSRLAPGGTVPSGRRSHTAIHDPVRDRMVVFGGIAGPYLNDVWALSLSDPPAWIGITPIGAPPTPREAHTAIYDPVRDRMVVFGGTGGSPRNDVWALSLSDAPGWSEIAPIGTPPAPRYGHSAIYDPVRDCMVVFGGAGDSSLNDVWALSLSGTPAWTEVVPSGSPPALRYGHSASYDAARDRMIVFGGYADTELSDVWALSLSGLPAWTGIAPSGTPPSGRSEHTAIHDPTHDRVVVFGGSGFGDLWALAWSAPVSVLGDGVHPPGQLELEPPRPNPSYGWSSLTFALREAASTSITVYDMAGRAVRILVVGQLAAGRHVVHWDGRDGDGRAVASGVYLMRLSAPSAAVVRKAIVIRPAAERE